MNKKIKSIAVLLIFLSTANLSFADGDNKFKKNTFGQKPNKNLPPMETRKGEDGPIPAGIAILLVGSLVFWGQKVRKKIKE